MTTTIYWTGIFIGGGKEKMINILHCIRWCWCIRCCLPNAMHLYRNMFKFGVPDILLYIYLSHILTCVYLSICICSLLPVFFSVSLSIFFFLFTFTVSHKYFSIEYAWDMPNNMHWRYEFFQFAFLNASDGKWRIKAPVVRTDWTK